MNFAYYPGCSARGSSKDYEMSTQAVCKALDMRLVDIPDWNCCGSTPAHAVDTELSAALCVRNLDIAAQQKAEVLLTPCPSCLSNLRMAARRMENPAFRSRVDELLDGPSAREFPPVTSVMQGIAAQMDMDAITARVRQSLKGLKLVAYYGCLMSRPAEVMNFGDPENPTLMEEMISACGAEMLDFPLKTACCGACTEKCPAKKTPDAFNELTGNTTAITIAFPQAIPKKAVINPQFCRQLIKGKCGVCAKVCPTGAIKYDMEDEIITEEVGSIVAATGYDLMDWTVYKEYGGGAYPDVITSLQYERLLSASGPTGGHVKRPSDGREPKNIVFVQCVGSRDKSVGRPYCSGFCCMYTAKQAILTKDHIPDSRSFVFYMDIRAPGKMYDEFTRRAMEEYGTEYIRGRVSQIYPDANGQMTVMGVDTLLGQPVEIKADLVVLAVGVEASKGSPQLAEKLRISYDSYGFFMESHVKLKPVETNTAGVYLAGVCQGVKDIPASVAQGSAAAAKVLALFSKDKLESDPQIAQVDIRRCVNCGKCIRCCPFGAIKEVEIRGEGKAQVIETVCQGCGLCTSTCPQGAIQLSHATDNQILAEVNALCQC